MSDNTALQIFINYFKASKEEGKKYYTHDNFDELYAMDCIYDEAILKATELLATEEQQISDAFNKGYTKGYNATTETGDPFASY
tara:strand:+ start:86 stop:337 length:252 start_codon:yes stop_codon:yes gene_type:complete